MSDDTYNMISVDGDTSTNDTVLLLANGAGRQNEEIVWERRTTKRSQHALHEINEYLAKKIAGDGEGAHGLFEVKCIGARRRSRQKLLQNPSSCSI